MAQKVLWEDEMEINHCADIPNLDGLLQGVKRELEVLYESVKDTVGIVLGDVDNFVNFSLQAPGEILESLPTFINSLPDSLSDIGDTLDDFLDDITSRLPRLPFAVGNGVWAGPNGDQSCFPTSMGLLFNEKAITYSEAIKILDEASLKITSILLKYAIPFAFMSKSKKKARKKIVKKCKKKLKAIEKAKNNLIKAREQLVAEHKSMKKAYYQNMNLIEQHERFLQSLNSEKSGSQNNNTCIDTTVPMKVVQDGAKMSFEFELFGKSFNYEIVSKVSIFLPPPYYIFRFYFCLDNLKTNTEGRLSEFLMSIEARFYAPSLDTNNKRFEYKEYSPKVLKVPIKELDQKL